MSYQQHQACCRVCEETSVSDSNVMQQPQGRPLEPLPDNENVCRRLSHCHGGSSWYLERKGALSETATAKSSESVAGCLEQVLSCPVLGSDHAAAWRIDSYQADARTAQEEVEGAKVAVMLLPGGASELGGQ